MQWVCKQRQTGLQAVVPLFSISWSDKYCNLQKVLGKCNCTNASKTWMGTGVQEVREPRGTILRNFLHWSLLPSSLNPDIISHQNTR